MGHRFGMLSSCVATCSHDCSFARQSTCTSPPRPAPRSQARRTVGRPAARDGQQRRAALAPRPANPCAAPQAAGPGGARVLLDAGRDPPACCAGGSPARRPSLLCTRLANPVWRHAPTGAARSGLPQRAGCGHGDPTVVRRDASDSASSSMAVSSIAAGSPLRRDCPSTRSLPNWRSALAGGSHRPPATLSNARVAWRRWAGLQRPGDARGEIASEALSDATTCRLKLFWQSRFLTSQS
jgi:hypothetical protein